MDDSLLIKALNRQAVERTPLWLMRQAGRYLPEYQKIRAQAGDFWTLCQTPELACEVTLQPLRRYDLDAAIVFSDILTVPQALGMDLSFIEKQGPVFATTITDLHSVQQLNTDGLFERLAYVFKTIQMVRAAMPKHLPLLGFSGSPWTLSCYMIEGSGHREFSKVFHVLYHKPEVFQALLTLLTEVVSQYLILQAQAGVQAVMLFDTWGGILPAAVFRQYHLPCLRQIIQTVKRAYPQIPMIVFSKGSGFWLPQLAELGAECLGLDWTVDLDIARQQVGHQVSLQGNLHPKVLLEERAIIHAEVSKILHAFGPHPGHIFNLGHGITPDVSPDAVHVLLDAVREVSMRLLSH